MKKNILLLVLAAMLFEPSFGQITKESYQRAVDILNYQSVYYSLSVLSPTSGATAKFKTNCNCENSPAFEKIKSSIPETELKTIEISSEIQELKSQDISAFDQSRALDFLLNASFNESKILKDFRNQLEQKGKLSDYKANLAQRLEGVLQESSQANTSSQNESESKLSALESRVQVIEQNQNFKEEKSGIFGGFSDYLIILAVILGVLGLFLALRKRDNYEELLDRVLKSKRLREKVKDFSQPQNSYNKNPHYNQSFASDLRAANDRIGDLDFQIKVLKDKIEQMTNPSLTQQAGILSQEVTQAQPKTEVFFLPSPNSDGSFDESSVSVSYKEGASIYKFTKQAGNFAQFQIDSREASVKLALQYRDKRIDPVCNAENAFNPRANRISTIKMGEAELQNGKWIINSKAVIRYED